MLLEGNIINIVDGYYENWLVGLMIRFGPPDDLELPENLTARRYYPGRKQELLRIC